jgi:hypothetical protein
MFTVYACKLVLEEIEVIVWFGWHVDHRLEIF